MDKTRIDVSVLLPEAPDEKDACITRIIQKLQYKRGIEKVHIIPKNGTDEARLCFHYSPQTISIQEVEKLAGDAGAALMKKYGHLLLSTNGVRHPRHARILEQRIESLKGVQSVSVSGTGFIQLEYDKGEIAKSTLLDAIAEMGPVIKHVHDFHGDAPSAEQCVHEHHKHSAGENEHAAGHTHCHDHSHGGIFGEKTEFIFAVISGVFLATAFGLSYVTGISQTIIIALYLVSYFFGGFFTAKEAYEGLRKGDFEIDFLMLVAAVGAAILGHWAEGALLLFLFSLGHALEHYAMEKARKSISALSDLAPKTALLKEGGDIREVPIESLRKGSVVLVKPHSKIPADGYVISGQSAVNQAPITGESVPVEKMAVEQEPSGWDRAEKLAERFKVFAGTINGSGALEIKVVRLAADSTIARLITLVNEAQTQKSNTQNFTNRIEKYYVPAVLITVGLLLLAFLVIDEPFSNSFYRAMAVLVAASPCALAISTPSAVLSGVARAARGGVLVKGGKPLEELAAVKAIAFDKTGTLTEGKPRLTGVTPLNNFPREELLEILVATEKLSDHPLAAAIVRGAEEELGREVPAAANVKAVPGRGIEAVWGQSPVRVGNKELILESGGTLSEETAGLIKTLEAEGNTTMVVQKDEKTIGLLTLMDVARSEAGATLAGLKKLGIQKMVMLTGDTQTVGKAVAQKIGLEDARGNLLPAQKVQAIEELKQQYGKIAMVGDGVNDAPAMAKSSVGIVMGAAGSDVALETADVALMADRLDKLPFVFGLSKKAGAIIRQNLIISLGMVALLVPLTISGLAQIGPAVVGHEGSTLIVVFNALRLLAYKQRAGHNG